MWKILIAVVAYCVLNLFVPKLWETFMTRAPEMVVNAVTFVAALACVGFIICADPVYERLKNPTANPIASTLIVIALSGAIGGAAWWQFMIPNRLAAPPISLTGIVLRPPYEVGKPIRFVIKLNNTAPGLKVRGRVTTVVGLIRDRSVFASQREERERQHWATYEQSANSGSLIKLSCTVGALEVRIDGPALTEIAVEHLNGPDGFVYVMGQLDYGSGALDFCGHVESSDPTAVILCVDHNGPVRRPAFK
ncbi:MAG TPA: hypothetical protein VF345_13225 [Chthoniobacterales bacterium]